MEKTVFLFVVLLGLALGVGKSAGMVVDKEGPMNLVRDVLKAVRNFADGEPLELPTERIFNGMSKMISGVNFTGMCSKIYGKICSPNNCDVNAYKCAKTFYLPEEAKISLTCILEAWNNRNDESMVNRTIGDCFVENALQIPRYSERITNETSYEEKVKKFLELLIAENNDISDDAKQHMTRHVKENACPVPPMGSCMKEHMRIKKCLMDTCAKEMGMDDNQ